MMDMTERLAVMKARQFLCEMRQKNRERLEAQRRDFRRKLELGNAVILARCEGLDPDEVIGLLLDAMDRMGN